MKLHYLVTFFLLTAQALHSMERRSLIITKINSNNKIRELSKRNTVQDHSRLQFQKITPSSSSDSLDEPTKLADPRQQKKIEQKKTLNPFLSGGINGSLTALLGYGLERAFGPLFGITSLVWQLPVVLISHTTFESKLDYDAMDDNSDCDKSEKKEIASWSKWISYFVVLNLVHGNAVTDAL